MVNDVHEEGYLYQFNEKIGLTTFMAIIRVPTHHQISKLIISSNKYNKFTSEVH